MQVKITTEGITVNGSQPGRMVRVQRDGPSPAQQELDATIQELTAEQARLRGQIRELQQSQPGSADLGRLRSEMVENTTRLRILHKQRADQELDEAARESAMRALRGGGPRGEARGEAVTTQPIPIHESGMPPEAVDISIAFFICTAAAVVLFPLMRSLGRVLERRAGVGAPVAARQSPEFEAQLRRMEQAIESVAIEVERVSEGQRFATKLLAEREKVEVR